MTEDYIQEFRTGDNPIEKMQELLNEVQKEEKQIDIPERDKLNNNEIRLPEEPEGNINVHGNWVHPLYGRLNNMMANNQSPIVIIVGKEGKGKSMTALQMAYTLHNKLNILRGDFEPETQTIYRVIEFLLVERDSTRKAIMFDEANETLGSNPKSYHSAMNKAVVGALRTQRKRENLHIFVCPEYKKLDKRIRQKVDILIDMNSKQYAKVRSYRMKHGKRGNRGLDYNYTRYPDWAVPDVPQNLQEAYDKIDNAFKGSYLDDLLIEVLSERIEEIEDQSTAKI